MTDRSDEDDRRRRREWIVAHHPDRGGDPHEFAAGLARFDAASFVGHPDGGTASGAADPRPSVYRSRNPLRRLRRALWPSGRRLL